MTITDDLRVDTGANSTLTFDAMVISGNVWNDDASHTLTINATNSSMAAGDAGTGNGETNIANTVTITVTCVTLDGTPIQNARVILVEDDSAQAEIIDGVTDSLTDVDGEVSTSYSYSGDQAVKGWVRKSSSSPYYQQGVISGTITTNGFVATVVLVSDE
jgi:hypothetical protein